MQRAGQVDNGNAQVGRYTKLVTKLVLQATQMQQGLKQSRARLILLKNRLHDDIHEQGAKPDLADAYESACVAIGRIEQQLGNLGALLDKLRVNSAQGGSPEETA